MGARRAVGVTRASASPSCAHSDPRAGRVECSVPFRLLSLLVELFARNCTYEQSCRQSDDSVSVLTSVARLFLYGLQLKRVTRDDEEDEAERSAGRVQQRRRDQRRLPVAAAADERREGRRRDEGHEANDC